MDRRVDRGYKVSFFFFVGGGVKVQGLGLALFLVTLGFRV